MLPGDAHTMLDLIGVRVVIVEGLGRDALFSMKAGLLVLDANLDEEDVNDLTDQVLSRAASALHAV